MKNIVILLLTLYGSMSCLAQEFHTEDLESKEHHNKFNQPTIGIAVPYSKEIGAAGINFRMYFNLGEKLCFGPEYSYFRNEEYEIVDFDFIAHYIFETPIVGLYTLLGGNYTVETDLSITEETEAAFGIIVGAGIHKNFNKIIAFAEYTRVDLGIDDQFVVAGLMLTIGQE